MIQQFIDFLNTNVPLNAAEQAFLRDNVPLQSVTKGTVLLAEGDISRAFYFILSGCVRMYYLVDGDERTACFYTEREFVSSYDSYTKQVPATHYFECVEDCELVVISQETAMQLLQRFPNFEVLARVMMEQELATYQKIIASFVTLRPEQRYLQLMQSNPELLQRIPQYHLATFLGVKPESLSRIRKRINSKLIS